MNMKRLANHIIAVANHNKVGVTPLHLQLTLFFTLREAYQSELMDSDTLGSIYDEPFKTTPYGPQIMSLREEYSRFTSTNIIEEQPLVEEYNFLNDTILTLLSERTSKLIKESYKHPLWKEVYKEKTDENKLKEYKIEDMKLTISE